MHRVFETNKEPRCKPSCQGTANRQMPELLSFPVSAHFVVSSAIFRLVYLLLLVDAELAGAAVDKKQETTNNRENLEEIVLGEILVGVMLVELIKVSEAIVSMITRE